MQIELETIIYIIIWSIIGLISSLFIRFRLSKEKMVEKTKSVFKIVSLDDLYKKLKQIAQSESELPPQVYTYSSGWKHKPPNTYHLIELENQFFSFKKKVERYYDLKGTIKLIEGNKSNELHFIFDQSTEFKAYIISIIIIFFMSILFTLLLGGGIELLGFLYYFLGPFFYIIFSIGLVSMLKNNFNQHQEQFMEAFREKLLT
ncbi:MAG TPA: hypothetical protein VMV49_13215 [Candidatus Deferrimicrobium sp.]|nr:hypothetical protein [Candidatus Deferrimicrobium sp.]